MIDISWEKSLGEIITSDIVDALWFLVRRKRLHDLPDE